MKHALSILVAAVIAAFAFAAPASARECKLTVVASGNASLLKALAYNSSLWAWRNAVKFRYGAEFQPWRRAEKGNQPITCIKGIKGGKSGWICTRRAKPCNAGSGPVTAAIKSVIAKVKGKKISKTLRRGDSGTEVEILQALLVDAGYTIKVDGKYGGGTETAVRDFQKSEGLTADGVAGPKTIEVLIG